MKPTKNELQYLAILKELEKDILQKLKKIEEKILTDNSKDAKETIPVLIMVAEELDDVLMNWEGSSIPRSSLFTDDDFDDDEFDD